MTEYERYQEMNRLNKTHALNKIAKTWLEKAGVQPDETDGQMVYQLIRWGLENQEVCEVDSPEMRELRELAEEVEAQVTPVMALEILQTVAGEQEKMSLVVSELKNQTTPEDAAWRMIDRLDTGTRKP